MPTAATTTQAHPESCTIPSTPAPRSQQIWLYWDNESGCCELLLSRATRTTRYTQPSGQHAIQACWCYFHAQTLKWPLRSTAAEAIIVRDLAGSDKPYLKHGQSHLDSFESSEHPKQHQLTLDPCWPFAQCRQQQGQSRLLAHPPISAALTRTEPV